MRLNPSSSFPTGPQSPVLNENPPLNSGLSYDQELVPPTDTHPYDKNRVSNGKLSQEDFARIKLMSVEDDVVPIVSESPVKKYRVLRSNNKNTSMTGSKDFNSGARYSLAERSVARGSNGNLSRARSRSKSKETPAFRK